MGPSLSRPRAGEGFSQPRFAERYRINLGGLRDLEQGRYTPDSAMLAYLRVIAPAPGGLQHRPHAEGIAD
jgi:DNA-binding transcriptional regulator YiaG